MKGYGYIITGFKRYFAYKAQVIARLISSPIELVIMLLIWTSIFNYSGSEFIAGFSIHEMINYYIIIWLMHSIVIDYSDNRIGQNIYNGHLSTRLLQPLQVFELYLSDSLGDKLGSILVQVIPFAIISVLFLGLSSPSIISVILAITSFILAYLIYFFFNMLFGLISFKLRAYRYVSRIKRMIVDVSSGKLLPLTMFPFIVNYLPFKYIYFEPANIFLGKYSIIVSLTIILTQVLWIVLLYSLFKAGWFKALKDFEGVGV